MSEQAIEAMPPGRSGDILSRAAKDKEVLPRQVPLYRQFTQAIFLGT